MLEVPHVILRADLKSRDGSGEAEVVGEGVWKLNQPDLNDGFGLERGKGLVDGTQASAGVRG